MLSHSAYKERRAYAYTRMRAFRTHKGKQLSPLSHHRQKKKRELRRREQKEDIARGGSRCLVRYDFSATINARTTWHIPAYFLFFNPLPLLPYHPRRNIASYRWVRALFNRHLRAAKVYRRLMPLPKKSQTAVYLYGRLGYKWLVRAPAHRAPDLQGNYHALIRESTARETICCITLSLLFFAPSVWDYTSFRREKRTGHWKLE